MRAIFYLAAGALMIGPAIAGESSDGLPPASSPLYSATSLYTGEVDLSFTVGVRKSDTILQGDAVGRIAGPLGGWLSGEGELLGLIYNSSGTTEAGVGGVGHLYKAAPNHALGLVAGAVSLDNKTTYAIGGEGKLYMGQNTLTGQVAYVRARDKYDYTLFGGQLDHYFTPDIKGLVNATYFDRQGSNRYLWTLMLGAEKRVAGTNWTVYGTGGYMGTRSSDTWAFRIGARKFFDAPGATLQQHDRLVPFNGSWLTTLAH